MRHEGLPYRAIATDYCFGGNRDCGGATCVGLDEANIAKLPELLRKFGQDPSCAALMSCNRLTVCVGTLSALYDFVDLRQ